MRTLKRTVRRLERQRTAVCNTHCHDCGLPKQARFLKPSQFRVSFAGDGPDDRSRDRCPTCNRLLVIRLEFDTPGKDEVTHGWTPAPSTPQT